jgi:hypothetical protein
MGLWYRIEWGVGALGFIGWHMASFILTLDITSGGVKK